MSSRLASTASDPITLSLPRSISIGGGSSRRVGALAHSYSIARPLVVTDQFMLAHGPVERALQDLRSVGLDPATYDGVQPDPTVANVEEALALARQHDADGVIAIGGGSPIDTAKAVAVMARNDGSIADYAGYHQVPHAGLPLIAVPTTAGTGSEATRVAVITDPARQVKMMLLDDHLLCTAALVDYELTLSCPPALTAHVGVDSLTHAIESYVSSQANSVTDGWALQAARLIAANLRVAVQAPENAEARAAMALGATLAGLAFSNASVALVHGMSRPLGAHFHLPHGLSNAVLLPAVTRYSLAGAPARYAHLAREIGFAPATAPDEEAGELLVGALQRLNEDLQVPTLGGLGVERARFETVTHEMAQAALASGSVAFNPRVPTEEEIVAIYDHAY